MIYKVSSFLTLAFALFSWDLNSVTAITVRSVDPSPAGTGPRQLDNTMNVGLSYYSQGTWQGSCGTQVDNSVFGVGLDPTMYGNGEHCGQTVQVSVLNAEGVEVSNDGEVVDLCGDCAPDSIRITQNMVQLDAPFFPTKCNWTFE